MGCDIHSYAEKKVGDKWEVIPYLIDETFLYWRSYRVFGWLAGVRNYFDVTSIAPVRGIPIDASSEVREKLEEWGLDAHTASWISLDEFLAFDYNSPVEDCRVTRQIASGVWSGGKTCPKGQGQVMTWKEFLGGDVIADLQKLQEGGAERIIFWFDN